MALFETPGRSAIRDHGDVYREKADRLAEDARQLFNHGRVAEAEEKARQIVNLQARVLGDKHPEYAAGLCLLAELLIAQDELADAETLLHRALEIRKKTVGESHPDYASSLDLLARLMVRWEDHAGAEPLLRKAMEIRKRALGEDHPEYAASLGALADVMRIHDALGEAEPLLREAVEVRRRVLGDGHPDLAASLCILADLLQRRGQNDEAEPLIRNALEVRRVALGEAHPDYVATLASLASILLSKGELDEAEPIWRLLLDMKTQSLGERHPECADIHTNLAMLLRRRGDSKGAEIHFRKAAEVRKHTLGERHPEYATSLTNLANLLQRAGELGAAEPLMRQALAIRKDVLGARHPEYATSLLSLALLVQKRGDAAWAKMLLKEAVDVRRAIYGEDHPEYAQCLAALADVLGQQGEGLKAEVLLRQALEIRRRALGDAHPAVAASLGGLASLARKQGNFGEAENLLRQALEIRKSALGVCHPDYATNLGNLAWILQQRGDRGGAERLLAEALEIRREVLGEKHPEFLQNRVRLQGLRDGIAPLDQDTRSLISESRAAYPQPPRPLAQPLAAAIEPPLNGDEACSTTVLDASTASAPKDIAARSDEEPNDREPLLVDEAVDSLMTDEPAVAELEPPKHDAHGPDGTTDVHMTQRNTDVDAFDPDDELLAESEDSCRTFDAQHVVENEARLSQMLSLDERYGGPAPFEPDPAAAEAAPDPLEPRAPTRVETDAWAKLVPGLAMPDEPYRDMLASEKPCANEDEPPTAVWSCQALRTEPMAAEPVLAFDAVQGPQVDEQPADPAERVASSDGDSPVFSHPNVRTTPAEDPSPPSVPFAGELIPARRRSMTQSSSVLSQELSELSDRFSELGERLLTAARQLHAPGTPPSDDLLEAVTASRRDFASLRDQTRELAASLHVVAPADEQLANLQDLASLLDATSEAELHQSKSEETRRRAISVLDRVLALSHASLPEFAPLRDLHEMGRSVRSGISEGAWKTLPPEASTIAEGDHHFAHLLSLIEDRDELSDEHWATLHESVGQAFGKSLAAAAARGKLVLPTHVAH